MRQSYLDSNDEIPLCLPCYRGGISASSSRVGFGLFAVLGPADRSALVSLTTPIYLFYCLQDLGRDYPL